MFTVYIRYFCYLTGKFSCVGVSELVSQFVSHELPSSVSNFVKEIEEEFSKNPPPAPEHSKLFYFSNYPIIDLAKVDVIDISDNSDNEEVWHRFDKLKVENEVKRREARKKPITKTKLKVGSVICISDDEEMSPQSVESSRENGVERAAKVITEASGLLSKFMDMNSSSKLTLKISKEELSLHIDPGSPQRRSSSDEDLQRSRFPPPQYPYNSSLDLRGEAPLWTPNAPPYVMSTVDGRCYYAPYNPAEFPRVPLESNNINRLTPNLPTTNQNLDRMSMKNQENRFFLWPNQQCVEGKNFDPSGFSPQDYEYYEEYRENNNLPTSVITPQLEVTVVKTESVDVANSPEPLILEEALPEALAEESVQPEPEGTSIIAAEAMSTNENVEHSSLENDPKYVAEASACGNLLLLSQVISDIVSSMSSPKKYTIMDSDENLNVNENKTLVFEPPSLTYTPEQLMLMKEDSTRERDDPMKYIIAVKNSVESDGCDDDGLLNLSSTGEILGEAQEDVKPPFSKVKGGKPQNDSFSDRSDSPRQRDTCIHSLKPARVPDSYLQDPRVSLLQYEVTSDSLKLETTDSSDSEIVLKIDDCGISSPENPGHTETKASPCSVYCTARETIKTFKTKAEQKEDAVKVPSDESEDDIPLQYRLIKYQYLNQGKSTSVSPLKRNNKGRLAQSKGKKAGKKKRHSDDSTRFYTLKLRSCSKLSSKESEIRTAFRSRGRPKKKPSKVRRKSPKVSKSGVDKPKKSANLPLVEKTSIRPSFSLEETYSLAATSPKKMFLFSFLRKTNKPLEDTTLMLLERQATHTERLNSDAQEAEKSSSKTEPIKSSDLEKSVENIKSGKVYTNNAKQKETIYVNIPKKNLFKAVEAMPSELNIPTTIPDNSALATAQRKLFNEIANASKSEEVALDVSVVGADAYDASIAADIPQVVVQVGLDNTSSLSESKKGQLLVELSANPAKDQQTSVINCLEIVKLQSAALAEEHSSENLEEARTSKMNIYSISDRILHSSNSKSAESICKTQTNEENRVEREGPEKLILEENVKLKKISTKRMSEEVPGASLNPESKIHVISNPILAGFEVETNTKGACKNHMELQFQKLPETLESSSHNSIKSEIKINISDKIISVSKFGSGSSKEELVEVLEKLVKTTKEVASEDDFKQNNKNVYLGKAQETSEELVIHQKKTEKVSNKSNEEVKQSKVIINRGNTKCSKAAHTNPTENRVPQQRKNRKTSDQIEKSNIEAKKSKQMTFENSSKSSEDIAMSIVEIRKPWVALEFASENLVTQQRKNQETSEQIQKSDKNIDKSEEVTIKDGFKPSDGTRERYFGSKKPQEKLEVTPEDLVILQMKNRNTSDHTQKPNEVENSKEGSFETSKESPENHVILKKTQELSKVASEDLFAHQRKKIKTWHQPQKPTEELEGSVKPSQNAIESQVEFKKHQGVSEVVSEDGISHQSQNENTSNKLEMSKEVIIEEKTCENSSQLFEKVNQCNIELDESLKVPEVTSKDKEVKHSIGITVEDSSKSSEGANEGHIALNESQKAVNSMQNDQTVKVPESSWKPSEGYSNNLVKPEKCHEVSKNRRKTVPEEVVAESSLILSRIDLDKTDDASGHLQAVEGAQNTEKTSEKPVEFPSYGKIHIISDRILRGSMAKISDNFLETNKFENALNVGFLSQKSSEDAGVASKEPEKKIIIISDWTLRGARTKIAKSNQKSKEPEPSSSQIEKATSKPTKIPETRNWRQEREKSFDAIAARAFQKTKLRIQTISNAEIALRKEEIGKVKASEEIGKALALSAHSSSEANPVRLPQAIPELAKTEKLDFIKARKDELKILDVAGKTENTETQIAGRYDLRRTLEDVLRPNSSQPERKQLTKNLTELSKESAFRQSSAISEKLDKNLDGNRRETSQNLLKEKQSKKESLLNSAEMKNKSKSPGKKIEDAILKVKHQIELKQDANAYKEAIQERLFRIDNETSEPLVPNLDSEVLMAKGCPNSLAGNNGCTKSLQIDFCKMAVKPLTRMVGFDAYLDMSKRKTNREKGQTKDTKVNLNVPIEFAQFERDNGEFVSNDKLKQIYKLEEGINAGNEFTFRLKNRNVKGQHSSSGEAKSSSKEEDQKERAERKHENSKIWIPLLDERGRKCFKSLETKREDHDKPRSKDLECYGPEADTKRCMMEEKDDKNFQKSTEKDQRDQREENRKFGKVYGKDIREESKCQEKEDTNRSKSYKDKRGDEDQKLGAKEREKSPENDAKNTVLLNEISAVAEQEHVVDKIEENTSERTLESCQKPFQKSNLDLIHSQGPSKPKDHKGSAKTIDMKPWLSKRPLTKAALKDMSQIPQGIDVESGEILLSKTQRNEMETLDKIKDMDVSLSKRPATKAALKEIPSKSEKAQSKANEDDIEEVSSKDVSIVLLDERDQKPPHAAKINMKPLEKVKKISQRERLLDEILEAKVSSSGLKKAETEELPEDISSNFKVQRYLDSLEEPRIDVTSDDGQNIKLQQLILKPGFTVAESIIVQKDIRNSQELSVPTLQTINQGDISEHVQNAFSYLENVDKSASEAQSVPHELLPSPLLLETALESGQCFKISPSGKRVELQPFEQQAHQLNTSNSTLEPLVNLESNSREFYVMLDEDRLTSQVNRKRKFTEQYTCGQVKKPMFLDKSDELKRVNITSSEDIAALDSLEDTFLKEQEKPCRTLVVEDCMESQHKFLSTEQEYYSGITDIVETTPTLNFNFDHVEDAESVATTLSEAVSSTATFPSGFQVFGQSNTQEHSQPDGLRSGDNEEKWVVRYYCPEDVGQIWSEYLQGEDQSKIETDQYETMDKMIGESQSREDVLEVSDINMGADTLGDANWTFLDNYMEELVIEDQVSVPFDIDDKPAIQQQMPDKKHFANSSIIGFPEPVGAHQPFPMHDVYFDAEFQHAVGMGLFNNLPDTLNQGKKSAETPMSKSAKEDFVSSLNFNIAAINNIMEFSQPTTFPDINFSDTQLLFNTSPEAPVEMRKTRKGKVVDAPSDSPKPSKTAKTEPKPPRSKSPKKSQHIVSFLHTSRKTGHCPPPPKIEVDSTTDISVQDLIIGSREASGNTRVHRSMNHYQPVFPVRLVDAEKPDEPPLKSAKGKRVTQSPKNGPQSRVQPILFDEPSLRFKTRSSIRQYTRKFASDGLNAIKTGSKTSNSIKLRQSKKNVKPANVDPFDLLKSSPNMNPSFEQQHDKRRRAANNEKSAQIFDAKQPNSNTMSW
ncbi:microtubule-associated protein futsch-like isoform X2 [Euwallacea similis]|uniref:microtubule-associated protein futsch-like isoform X2 n=1 Tax=Euwallacea similis TaxID=1736056 RepID=UPI00344CD6FA